MKILSRGTCLALALALLIVGFASPLPAADQTDPQSAKGTVAPKAPAVKEAAPAGAGSASLRIPGAAFRPRDSSVDFAGLYGGYMYAISSGSLIWNAPVYLPQGAVVTSVRMYYNDTNTQTNCNGWFTACKFSDQSELSWVATSSGSAGFGYADTAAINHTIDYNQYAYILQWCPLTNGNSMQLGGFQIFYTPPPGRAAVIPLN